MRRGACREGRLQVALRLNVSANQTQATGSEGMIRFQGGVSIATMIGVAPELGADGGDQHGGSADIPALLLKPGQFY